MSYRSDAIGGVKWSGLSQAVRQVVQFVTVLVLAKFLQPSDFGLMGMVLVVVGFLNIFKDVGTSSALIHSDVVSQELFSSIFWMNVLVGITISVMVFFGAPVIADFFQEMRLVPLLRFLTIAFLSTTLAAGQQALLEKHLRFKLLAHVEIASVFLGAMTGIGAAMMGAGVWSMAYQQTVAAVVLCSGVWMQQHRRLPSRHFHWKDIGNIAQFSSNLTGFTFFNYFLRSADSIIIGRFLGADALGLYSLTYKVIITPFQNVSSVITRVMFPLFSSIADDHVRLRTAYTKVALTIATVFLPIYASLFIIRHEFVELLFGDRWMPMAGLLVFMIPLGFIQTIDSTTGTLFLVKGRTDIMLRWGLITGILSIAAFSIGAQWGLTGVAIGYLTVTVLWTYLGFSIPLGLLQMSGGTFLRKFIPLLCIIAVSMVTAGCAQYVLQGIVSVTVQACITVLVLLSMYGVLSTLLLREQIDELRAIIANI